MQPRLTLLYRGPLSSCNYACHYCPFAKRRESRRELEHDRQCLQRFVNWLEDHSEVRFEVMFTPWGEALVRRYYRQALEKLSGLPHLEKLVIQTNLSAPLEFTRRCEGKLRLWATYHPEWTSGPDFLRRCQKLYAWNVPFSVGCVGLEEHLSAVEWMRQNLPTDVYLWINAVKAALPALKPEVRQRFSELDPLFELNTQAYPSLGRSCRGGEQVFSIDGQGNMRTCHFQPEVVGNLYRPDWERALQPRTCQSDTCRCYIGYIHLPHLNLERHYGSGLLERIPQTGVR